VKLSAFPVVDRVPTVPSTLTEPTPKNRCNGSDAATKTEPVTNSSIAEVQQPQPGKERNLGVWGVFSSTFFTIFLAEMGDKTQLATMLMSAQSHAPWVVFTGAAAALIATSLLGVLVGCWLARRLSPKTLETSAGALLLFISVLLLWDVVNF
jgi:putative Ca2+/H+ antiporter (TMEM165/GDT1 family)